MQISYIDRQNNCKKFEKVYGDKAIENLYGNPIGRLFSNLLATKGISDFYGKYQDSLKSTKVIPQFVKDYEIDMSEYIDETYKSFNQFFIRKFKSGKRHFVSEQAKMAAFAEARYFAYNQVDPSGTIPVKGKFMTPESLVANDKWSAEFQNGPLLLARLCPVDYHRFHFPFDGKIIDSYRVKGKYHSVNPVALKNRQTILSENERHVTIVENEKFGKVAMIDVGAMMVGKIVQTYQGDNFKRGDEKGYFLFGGSTVIVVGQKGRWLPSTDLIHNTQSGIETYIRLGEEVATLCQN